MEKQVFGISEHLLFLPSVVKCPFFRDTLTERTGTEEVEMENETKKYDDAAIALIDARCKSNTHRLDDVEKHQETLDSLAASVKVLASREERVESDVKEIKADVKELAARPVKRWDGIVDKVLYAIIGAFVTWLFYGGAA